MRTAPCRIRGEEEPRDSLTGDTAERRRVSSQSSSLVPGSPRPQPRPQPAQHSPGQSPGPTVISVTPCTTASRDSLDQDSGNPESELTSERASRSPSDYRSLDCDSLSVDDCSGGEEEGGAVGGAPRTTVIHLTGEPAPALHSRTDIPSIDTEPDCETEVGGAAGCS